ncbi:MAG TPA: alpha/beta hydrolase [bacterium]|nr:alpha/beta hydrolase [bacterium]
MNMECKYTFIQNNKIFVRTKGYGEPIILIHGMFTSSLCWINTIHELANSYKVYALDLPGWGESDKPKVNYSTIYYAQFLNEFMRYFEIEKSIFVGHSIGGQIALSMAVEYPKKVKKLILVNSGGILPSKLPKLLFLFKVSFIGYLLSCWIMRKSAIKSMMRNAMFFNSQYVTDDVLNDAFKSSKYAFSKLMGNLTDLRDRLSEIGIPTLIIWGKKDRSLPLDMGSLFNKLIPNSVLEVIQEAGHYPQIEKPEVFNSIIQRFLSDG